MSTTILRSLLLSTSLSLAVGCAHKKAAEPAKAEAAPAPVAAKPGGVIKGLSKPLAERVRVEKNAIKIDDRIYFETGVEKIDAKSFELLDQVAKTISEHAELKKLRIEGHTDNTGKADFNKKLSQGRAEAVMQYLVSKGIAKDRLEAQGFGQEKPIASNETEEGRDQNRRVEFAIVQ